MAIATLLPWLLCKCLQAVFPHGFLGGSQPPSARACGQVSATAGGFKTGPLDEQQISWFNDRLDIWSFQNQTSDSCLFSKKNILNSQTHILQYHGFQISIGLDLETPETIQCHNLSRLLPNCFSHCASVLSTWTSWTMNRSGTSGSGLKPCFYALSWVVVKSIQNRNKPREPMDLPLALQRTPQNHEEGEPIGICWRMTTLENLASTRTSQRSWWSADVNLVVLLHNRRQYNPRCLWP